jgi:hypothetical protein
MNTLRRLGLSLSVLLFSLGISVLALLVSLHFVVDTPQPLKQAISTSGIYDVLVQDTVAKEESISSSLPMSDPGLQEALEQALPPSFVQSSSEQVINSTYNWIQGDTTAPNFSVDLNQARNDFADNVASYIQQKLGALPPCAQLMLPPTSVQELLDLTCMPRGVSIATIANTARQEALSSKLFSEDNVININTFKDKQGRPVTDQLTIIPKVHQFYTLSLYVLPVLILLLAIGVLFWSITKRAGIKRIAWLLISAGVTAMVFAVVEVWLLHAGISIFGIPATASPTLQDKLLMIVETLSTDLRIWWFGFGAGYTLLGVVLLIVLRFNKPRPELAMGEGRIYKQPSSLNEAPNSAPANHEEKTTSS